MVFHAGWPIRLVSLDVTMQTPMQRDQVNLLAQLDMPVPLAIKQMVDYFFDVFAPAWHASSFHMHDPLALAAAFRPDLITWEPAYVDVELQGALTLGETVAYFHRSDVPSPNLLASVDVDANAFMELFLSRIQESFA
jgi:inosine-uridine nucleoside N-ribohydrolase